MKVACVRTWSAMIVVSFLVAQLFLRAAEAGCGCDKPPPQAAAVVPNFGSPGMPISLFDTRFQAGQLWTVRFLNGASSTSTTASVVLKRSLTANGAMIPQLVAAVPESSVVGPTTIVASSAVGTVTVPLESFTVIAKPVMASEQEIDFDLLNYTTGVSADGTLYLSVGGLDKVCKSMKFDARADGFPFRFSQGTAVIFNHQGFLIDALTPQSVNRFEVRPETSATRSDRLVYQRHSFAQYCLDHQPGGIREVDPTDPNWHKNGTPHVDYSTLIFAIVGTANGGRVPAGRRVSELSLNLQLGPGNTPGVPPEPWETEIEEENQGPGSVSSPPPAAPTTPPAAKPTKPRRKRRN
jgi:hypothetical protein